MAPINVAGRMFSRVEMALYEYLQDESNQYKYRSVEVNVVWLLRSQTTLQVLHSGKVLTEGQTYTDFPGYLQSLKANGDHLIMARTYAVDRESSMEIRLHSSLHLQPFVEDEVCRNKNDQQLPSARFMLRESTQFRVRTEEQGIERCEYRYSQLPSIVLAERTSWSSKNAKNHNDRLRLEIESEWNDEAFQHGEIGNSATARIFRVARGACGDLRLNC